MKQNKYFLYLLVCLLAIVHTPKLLGQNVQVNVEVSNTLTNIAQNPVGLCLSYPHDDTDYFPNRVRSTTEAFNSIQGGTLRFPMGALADNYLWHEPGDYQNAVNGLNPRIASEGRNPAPWDWLVNTDGTIKDSALDFDEFVDLYQQTGTEPIIMVNAFGHVDAESLYSYEQIKTNAVEWVRYANITKNLNIKYWEIGNELSVEVNKGHITVQEYIDLFNDFADAMKAVDPTIKVGLGLGFGHFDQVLAGTYTKADFVVPHQYQGFENYNEYKNLISPPPLTYITNANNAISNLPAPYRDTIEILATEFSSFSPQGSWKSPNGSNDPANTIGKSLVTFEMITSALAQYDRIAYMHFWTTHSAFNAMGFSDKYANAFDQYLNTLPQGNALTIFNMFRKDRMVQTSSTSSLIRSYASYSPNSEELSIYLINKDTNPVPVDINNIDNASQLGSGNIWTYAGNTGSPEDTATSISQTGTASPQGNGYSITLPPVSVTVINTTANTATVIPPTGPTSIDNESLGGALQWTTLPDPSGSSYKEVRLLSNSAPQNGISWEFVPSSEPGWYNIFTESGEVLQLTNIPDTLGSVTGKALRTTDITSDGSWKRFRLVQAPNGKVFIENQQFNSYIRATNIEQDTNLPAYFVHGADNTNTGVWTQWTITSQQVEECSIVPHFQINGGVWQDSITTINATLGDTVLLGPESNEFGDVGGNWNWVGPNGFSASTREITLNNIQLHQAGTYTVSNSDQNGCTSTLDFMIAVTGFTDEYYIDNVGLNLRLKSNGTDTGAIATNTGDMEERTHWNLVDAGNGKYFIESSPSGKRLRCNNANGNDTGSVDLVANTYSGSWVQWELIPIGSYYFIENEFHGARLRANSNQEIVVGTIASSGLWVQWELNGTGTGTSAKSTQSSLSPKSEPTAESEVFNTESLSNPNLSMAIFPNPVNASFTIKFNKKDEGNLFIYNPSGQLVYAQKYNGDTIDIDNGAKFKSGLYFVKCVSATGEVNDRRILVK